ncbi:hypothetical protein Tco_1221589 [Tanacetum coccineum]
MSGEPVRVEFVLALFGLLRLGGLGDCRSFEIGIPKTSHLVPLALNLSDDDELEYLTPWDYNNRSLNKFDRASGFGGEVNAINLFVDWCDLKGVSECLFGEIKPLLI